ncbi:hypothetical protein F511_06527 [Dorcoceras hygrometricum]|uniref:Uncharacterized protein n=1 Tax=Dorcoceras hygrometricum TaxID=472368 RepID=A0A2Z7D2A7_9LAMI|nr:hypothetical protein F511_06527 [Dorcoceras hygrometricum]
MRLKPRVLETTRYPMFCRWMIVPFNMIGMSDGGGGDEAMCRRMACSRLCRRVRKQRLRFVKDKDWHWKLRVCRTTERS